MTTINPKIALIGALSAFLLHITPACAQATRTWVSGVGDDVNPCSRTAPCKTFAGAISKTAVGGIINCLDPGGFGAVTITKSITFDCTGTFAGVLVSGTNGIVVSVGASDIVILRGLNIQGVAGTGLIGVNIIQAGTVQIEHCNIWGFNAGSALGVFLQIPDGVGSRLNISDSVISQNGSGGTSGGGIIASATGSGTARVSLNRVSADNNSVGVRVQSNQGGTGQVSLSMRDSTANGNGGNGVEVLATGAATVLAALDNGRRP